MRLNSSHSSLALASLTVLVIGCAAKEPDKMIPLNPPSELSEQDVVLTKLSAPDVMQVLFDELSRIAWFTQMADKNFPAEDTKDGCFLYQGKPEANLVVVGADCTGPEPRSSGDSLDRTVQGSGVLRQLESGHQYAGSFNVLRFRPNQPKKIVRMAVFEPSILMVDASAGGDPDTQLRAFSSTSEFKGVKAGKIKRAESWSSSIEGELYDSKATLPRIESMKSLGIRYRAENGDSTILSMVPDGHVTFASTADGTCLRPIGTFSVTTRATVLGEDGGFEQTATQSTIETTTEGFATKGTTKVTPWPKSCFENTQN